jgi:hypothetical protein
MSDVRFGSKADMCNAPTHVRFTPNSDRKSMSALPPKADMCGALGYVRFGPIADMGHINSRRLRGNTANFILDDQEPQPCPTHSCNRFCQSYCNRGR